MTNYFKHIRAHILSAEQKQALEMALSIALNTKSINPVIGRALYGIIRQANTIRLEV